MSLWRDLAKNLMAMFQGESGDSQQKRHVKTHDQSPSGTSQKTPYLPPSSDPVDLRKRELLVNIYKIMSEKREEQHNRRANDRLQEKPTEKTSTRPKKPT